MNQQNLFAAASDNNSIASFAKREAHRMWPSEEHSAAVHEAGRFVDFRDHATKPISHFLPRDIHAFADHLAADGNSPATVNRYLAAISKVFNHAVDEQLINQAPKLKFNKEDNHRIRYYTIHEQNEMIAYSRGRRADVGAGLCRAVAEDWRAQRRDYCAVRWQGRSVRGWTVAGAPADVTKTRKGRNVPLNKMAREAALRLAGSGAYT